MALPVVEYLYGFPVLDPTDSFFNTLYEGSFHTATSTKLVLEAPDGERTVFKGDFTLTGDVVTGGTVDSFKVFAGETKVMTESGLDISATALIDAVVQWQSFNFDPMDDLLLDIPTKYVGSDQADFMVARGPDSTLTGRAGDDELIATGTNSTLKGGKGGDLLIAEEGFSWYSGGKGDDVFSFSSPTTPNKIKDFGNGHDLIELNPAGFEGVGPGFLHESQFKLGSNASTEDQIILYQKGKGNLWYDQDGSGSTYAPVKFAKVDAGTDLHHKDFYGDYSGAMLIT